MNKCQVVELFDGRGTLLMILRSNHGRNLCAHALSNDGVVTWTTPADAEGRMAPVCPASFIRHEPRRLVFSNPAAKTRVNQTVRLSHDDARTWCELTALHPGPSAYSSLVSLDAKTVGCLYETGAKKPEARITFARFALNPP